MSFWGLNIGLAWMSFVTLFPLGIRQLYESVNAGYFEARSLDYLSTNTNTVIEWLRLPGDAYFILVGWSRCCTCATSGSATRSSRW